jgi:hypothetical protein
MSQPRRREKAVMTRRHSLRLVPAQEMSPAQALRGMLSHSRLTLQDLDRSPRIQQRLRGYFERFGFTRADYDQSVCRLRIISA